jgi:nicotinamidase-related amidase
MTDILPAIDPRHTALLVMDFQARALGAISQAPEPADIVVRKTRVGAFSTTDLDTQLRDRNITTLILAGITTSGVVLSTLRDAHDRDYRVVVLADAGADSHSDVHDFLIEKIFPRQAQVITIAGLPALLSAG